MVMIFALVLLPALRLVAAVQVQRCCSAGQRLSHSFDAPNSPTCVDSDEGARSLPEVQGLDLSSERKESKIVLEEAQQTGFPTCQEYQVHKLGLAADQNSTVEGWITSEGELITTRFEADFQHGQFCVEYGNTTKSIVAVMCNPCRGSEVTCISLCCPHGHAMLQGGECQARPGGAAVAPKEVWSAKEQRLVAWERNKHYILEAPQLGSQGFNCPKNSKDSLVRQWAEQKQGEYRLQKDGSLQGINLPDYVSEGGLGTKNQSWAGGHFCIVVGSPPDYDSYDYDYGSSDIGEGEEDFVETFMECYDTDPYNWCTEFTNDFHPVAIVISIVFLVMTLAAYAFEKSLRDHLHGKMTVVFLCNLTICFFVAALSWFEAAERGGGGCILSGYLIQYFFLAFFFCLNAIALNIYLPFSKLSGSYQKVSETGRLVAFLLYAQGLPFLVCALTAIIDATGPAKQSDRVTRPNMGVYRCFLGAEYRRPARSYFVQPDFIYFHSVIILLQVSNLVLLGLTVAHLMISRDGGGTRRQNIVTNFGRFAKLFIILGFYWTGDILSTALALEYGQEKTCGFRIFADLTGLFSGVLLFVVLVCNKQVLGTLCRNRCSWLSPERDLEPQEMEETRVSDQ